MLLAKRGRPYRDPYDRTIMEYSGVFQGILVDTSSHPAHTMSVGQEFSSLLAGPVVIVMMQALGQDTVPAEL